jgi:hypothetical protein
LLKTFDRVQTPSLFNQTLNAIEYLIAQRTIVGAASKLISRKHPAAQRWKPKLLIVPTSPLRVFGGQASDVADRKTTTTAATGFYQLPLFQESLRDIRKDEA